MADFDKIMNSKYAKFEFNQEDFTESKIIITDIRLSKGLIHTKQSIEAKRKLANSMTLP